VTGSADQSITATTGCDAGAFYWVECRDGSTDAPITVDNIKADEMKIALVGPTNLPSLEVYLFGLRSNVYGHGISLTAPERVSDVDGQSGLERSVLLRNLRHSAIATRATERITHDAAIVDSTVSAVIDIDHAPNGSL
jgi:hypothetical protein